MGFGKVGLKSILRDRARGRGPGTLLPAVGSLRDPWDEYRKDFDKWLRSGEASAAVEASRPVVEKAAAAGRVSLGDFKDDDFITEEKLVAALPGLTKRTLRRWRGEYGCPSVKVGKLVFFSVGSVRQWLKAREGGR